MIDGTFAWQASREDRVSSNEPSSDSVAAAADSPQVDHTSDDAAMFVHETVQSDHIRLALMNINFTIPKVLLSLFLKIQTTAETSS